MRQYENPRTKSVILLVGVNVNVRYQGWVLFDFARRESYMQNSHSIIDLTLYLYNEYITDSEVAVLGR